MKPGDGKLAIFICGPVRYAVYVNRSIERIFSGYDYDCFYHIWKEDLGNKVRAGEVKDLEEIEKHPRTKVFIRQEPYRVEDFAKAVGTESGSNSSVNATMGMFFSVNLLCHYLEQLPDFSAYRYILRLRTDCAIINPEFSSLLDGSEKTLTFAKSYFIPDTMLCDHLCFGCVEDFFSVWRFPDMQAIYKSYLGANRNPETVLQQRLQKKPGLHIRENPVRFRDYHIVYLPTRDCEPDTINQALNSLGVKEFFRHAAGQIDFGQIDHYNAQWKRKWIQPKKQEQREMENVDGSYYNKEYFEWQKAVGQFGGIANLFKFAEYVRPDHTVLDFGCGGGYLLERLNCRGKIGIEINESACREARSRGLTVYPSADQVEDGIADVIISNHALEHVSSPVEVLKNLYRKLKPGGRIVFVVPHQDTREKYDPADKNKHLFTWNQLTLGNLFEYAGYRVEKAEVIQHQWPPRYEEIYRAAGEMEFHRICCEYARQNHNFQIRIVAARPCSVLHTPSSRVVPTVLITYNRPLHTERVLQSLCQHNVQNLLIFSDAPRSPDHEAGVLETRNLIGKIRWTEPEVICQQKNLGLAASIVRAVNYTLNKYDRLILLEDDCVPQRFFYDHMFTCLEKYQDHSDIFGISGHTVQIPDSLRMRYPYDIYFSPRIGSWGWATWKRSWAYYQMDLRRLVEQANATGVDFTCGGLDIPMNLERFLSGQLRDVWTLHWVLSVYNQRGAYIYPVHSHIQNIGVDGSGVHCGKTALYESSCAGERPSRYPDHVLYCTELLENFRNYFRIPAEQSQRAVAFLRTIQGKQPMELPEYVLK